MKRLQAVFSIQTSLRHALLPLYLRDHLGNNRVVMAGYLKCGPAALFYPEIALAVF